MKCFIFKVCLFAIIMVVIFAALSFLPGNPFRYDATFAKKQFRLKKEQRPKLVFIGGSNLAFGMDSELVQTTFQMPALNDGLHAGSGLYFICETSLPELKSGDVAVLVFEYAHFFGEASGSVTATSFLMYDLKNFQKLSWKTVFNMLPHFPKMGWDRLSDVRYLIRKGRWKRPSHPYSMESFNDFGDLIGHLDLQSKTNSSLFCGNVHPDLEAVDFLCSKIKSLRKRGVFVALFPPVFQKSSYENWRTEISNLRTLFRKREMDFDASPARYALDDAFFYDTVYHLNAKGRELRTKLLIEDLERMKREGIILGKN